jgi:uroporphyrinogen III methyltransferase/synthase
MAGDTPAAYISAATRPIQRCVQGTIDDLPFRVGEVRDLAPALVIVGKVVTLQRGIEWFQMRPLSGRRILVARARPGRSRIAAELRAAGASVPEAPHVVVSDFPFLPPIATALSDRQRCEGVVFGCTAGVEVSVRHHLLRNCPSPCFRSRRSSRLGVAPLRYRFRRGLRPRVL